MNSQKYVEIKFQIWKDDNVNGLFDYKSDNSKKKYYKFKINEKCLFIKTNNNEIKCIKDYKELINPNEDIEILFGIRKSFKSNDYEITNPKIEHKINIKQINNFFLNDKIWYPVKSFKCNSEGNNQVYSLNENDIIKLGRRKYNVHKIHLLFQGEKNKIKDDNCDKINNISYISSINKKSKPVFNIDIKVNQYKSSINKDSEKVNEDKNETFLISRSINKFVDRREIQNEIINQRGNNNEIKNEYEYEYDECSNCFGTNSSKDNPLIRLCNCTKYIHFHCLKEKLAQKKKISEDSKAVKTYILQNFKCEKCSKSYHLRFRIPEFDKVYELIDLIFPEEKDYICLESLDYIKENNIIKTIHIIELNDQKIFIGRQDYNDILIQDISISRDHAILEYNKNNRNLILIDRNTKFGTLVLVRGNIKIKEEKTFLQSGKINISIEVKDKKCLKTYKNNNDNYYDNDSK